MKITRVETDNGEYFIELRDIKKNLFGVFDMAKRRKHRNNDEWDREPLPSNRTDEWIQNHSFTFEEAILELQKISTMRQKTMKKPDCVWILRLRIGNWALVQRKDL